METTVIKKEDKNLYLEELVNVKIEPDSKCIEEEENPSKDSRLNPKIKTEDSNGSIADELSIKYEEIEIKLEQDVDSENEDSLDSVENNKTPSTLFRCDECSYSTKWKRYLKSHMDKHRMFKDEDYYKCKFCDYKTKSKYVLKPHMLIHKDPSEITWYKCDLCPFASKMKSGLKAHTITHKSITEMPMNSFDKKRSSNFTVEEISVLKAHIFKKYNTLYGKVTRENTWQKKKAAWEAVLGAVNAVSPVARTVIQLKKKFKDLKRESRKRLIEKYQARKAAGDDSDLSGSEVDSDEEMLKIIDKTAIRRIADGGSDTFKSVPSDTQPSCSSSSRSVHVSAYAEKNEIEFPKSNVPLINERTEISSRETVLHTEKSTQTEFSILQDQLPRQGQEQLDLMRRQTLAQERIVQLLEEYLNRVPVFKCDLCHYVSKVKADLRKHQLTHKKREELVMHKCPMCTYESRQKHHINQHMLSHRCDAEVPVFICYLCSHTTKHKSNLAKHIWRHSRFAKIPFPGSSANRTAVKKEKTQCEAHKCEVCGHRSPSASDLSRHMLKHKEKTEVQMFKCAICMHQTKRKNDLINHMLVHKDPSEIAMFMCGICDYKAKHKSNLTKHLARHREKGEKGFQCHKCLLINKSKGALIRHLRSAHR